MKINNADIVFGELDSSRPYMQVFCDAVDNQELVDAIGTSLEFLDDEPVGSYVFWPDENLRVEIYVRGLLR